MKNRDLTHNKKNHQVKVRFKYQKIKKFLKQGKHIGKNILLNF